jgi:hypothetical protein
MPIKQNLTRLGDIKIMVSGIVKRDTIIVHPETKWKLEEWVKRVEEKDGTAAM